MATSELSDGSRVFGSDPSTHAWRRRFAISLGRSSVCARGLRDTHPVIVVFVSVNPQRPCHKQHRTRHISNGFSVLPSGGASSLVSPRKCVASSPSGGTCSQEQYALDLPLPAPGSMCARICRPIRNVLPESKTGIRIQSGTITKPCRIHNPRVQYASRHRTDTRNALQPLDNGQRLRKDSHFTANFT